MVVPTYREADNLSELVDRVTRTLDAIEDVFEIIVVDDDSQDGTDDVIRRLAGSSAVPVRLITRQGERGLSSAVLRGFESAYGNRLVCMDADFSHPPESLPALLAPLQDGHTEFVVGSRYVAGASTDEQWTWFRRLNSRIATWLARPFTRLRDPMAGFFAVPRSVFQRGRHWDPVGYKIGLEVLVKSHCRVTREIPIHFSDRKRGSSKLNWKEQRNYLIHLCRLADFRFPTWWRLIKFCCVGCMGAAVDLASFALLLASGFPLTGSRVAAIWLGMSMNFVGNEAFTFGTRKYGRYHSPLRRFVLACSFGAMSIFSSPCYCHRSFPLPQGTRCSMPPAGSSRGPSSISHCHVFGIRSWTFVAGRSSVDRLDPSIVRSLVAMLRNPVRGVVESMETFHQEPGPSRSGAGMALRAAVSGSCPKSGLVLLAIMSGSTSAETKVLRLPDDRTSTCRPRRKSSLPTCLSIGKSLLEVRDGRDYYAAAHEGLLAHGFPVASPLNWRLPTYAWIFSAVADDRWMRWTLMVLAMVSLSLAWRASRRSLRPVGWHFRSRDCPSASRSGRSWARRFMPKRRGPGFCSCYP